MDWNACIIANYEHLEVSIVLAKPVPKLIKVRNLLLRLPCRRLVLEREVGGTSVALNRGVGVGGLLKLRGLDEVRGRLRGSSRDLLGDGEGEAVSATLKRPGARRALAGSLLDGGNVAIGGGGRALALNGSRLAVARLDDAEVDAGWHMLVCD